jgi:hypothetical protein
MVKDEVLSMDFVGFGVAAGLFVPGYMDAGYLGIVLILVMAGATMQWMYNRARSGGPEWLAVYAFVVANATLSVYGSLVNSFSVLLLPGIAFTVFRLGQSRNPLTGVLAKVRRRRPSVSGLVMLATAALFSGLVVMTALGASQPDFGSPVVGAGPVHSGIPSNDPGIEPAPAVGGC